MSRQSKSRSKLFSKISQDAVISVTVTLAGETFDTTATHSKAIAKWKHGALLGLLASLCAALYAWTLDFPFAFDDVIYLVNNPFVKDASSFGYLSNFHTFANKATALGIDIDYSINFILRPIAYVTFHLNYVFDGLTPYWYRAVNVVIHGLNSMLIYALLLRLLTRLPESRKLSSNSVAFIAGTAALVFAVHPLATESVTYIVQRFTSLVALFYLITLLLHFHAATIQRTLLRRSVRVISVLILVLGMLTKESCFTAPVVAVLLDAVLLGTALRTALWRALPLVLCMTIIPALLIATTWAQQDGSLNYGDVMNIVNFGEKKLSVGHYAITQLTVIVEYLRLLVWPSGMNVDPDWTVHSSLLETSVLGAVAIIMGLLSLSVWLLFARRERSVHGSIVGMFLLWFFVTISVTSSIVPLPDMIAEHRTYLPSIGLFVAIACILDWFRVRLSSRRVLRWLAPATAIACSAALSFTTLQRNEVWRSTVSLWEDTATKSPAKARVLSNLGFAYGTAGDMAKALPCFEKAVELQPKFLNGWKNLLTSQLELARFKEVLNTCDKMLIHYPDAQSCLDVAYSRGVALCGVGKVDDGLRLLLLINNQAPTHLYTQAVLGRYYLMTKQEQKARAHFENVLRLVPNNQEAQQALQSLRSVASNHSGL
jgi:protein O-mannosyl-transferase